MPARKTITAEDVLPFIPRLESRKLTRAQLAKELGVCLPTLRRELKKLEVVVPTKRHTQPLHERLLALYSEEQLQTLSQYEIAKELNIKILLHSNSNILEHLHLIRLSIEDLSRTD